MAGGLPGSCCLAALPAGDVLVGSAESGELLRVHGTGPEATITGIRTLLGFPDRNRRLLDVAVPPDFAGDGDWIYVYFTNGSENRINRFAYAEDGGETQPTTVLEDIPAAASGSLAFGPDGMLYATTEHTEAVPDAPPPGAILRIDPGNGRPFGLTAPQELAHAVGFASPQGLAWDAGERLWAVDAVPGGEVEVNSVAPGGDYGWPEVSGIVTDAAEQGYVNPVDATVPAEEEPSGLAHAGGSLWMTTAGGATLWRFPLDGTQLVAGARPQPFREAGGEELGALRDVLATPEGGLLVLTGDGRLLRLAVR